MKSFHVEFWPVSVSPIEVLASQEAKAMRDAPMWRAAAAGRAVMLPLARKVAGDVLAAVNA